MHRIICLVNAKNEEDVYKIARNLFAEHIQRSVKYGGRSEKSIINDYLINPHYRGLSIKTLLEWMGQFNLNFYSMYPNIEIPFAIDSPYFKPLEKDSKEYKNYLALLELRWLFAQDADKSTLKRFSGMFEDLEKIVDEFLYLSNQLLQHFDSGSDVLQNIKEISLKIEDNLDNSFKEVTSFIIKQYKELNNEYLKILEMVIEKKNSNIDFDMDFKSEKLFKGYNGLGTSYIIFRKI